MVRIMQNSSSWHNYRWPSDASLFRVLGINHTCPCDGCSPAIHYYGALAPQDDNVVSRMMPTVGSPSSRTVLRGTLVQHVDSPLSTVAAGEESFWQHDGSRCCEEKPLSTVAVGEEPLVSLLRGETVGKQRPRDGELPLLGRDAVNAPLVPIARVAMAAPRGPARRRWSPHSRPARAVPGRRVRQGRAPAPRRGGSRQCRWGAGGCTHAIRRRGAAPARAGAQGPRARLCSRWGAALCAAGKAAPVRAVGRALAAASRRAAGHRAGAQFVATGQGTLLCH